MESKLQQAKNEIAKEYGYKDFEDFDDKSTFGYNHKTPEIISDIAIRYNELCNEWVSVDERLPEIGIGIILHLDSGYIGTGYRSKSENNYNIWYLFQEDLNFENDKLTHWMPLPTPPNK